MMLLETLANNGVINQYQIDDILEKTQELGGDIDQALAFFGIDSRAVRAARSQASGVPESEIDLNSLRYEDLKFIPEASARLYRSVSFGTDSEGAVMVGMVDPTNLQARNALQFIFSEENTPYKIFVISYDDFNAIMEQALRTTGASVGSSSELGTIPENEVPDLETILDEVEKDEPIDESTIVEDAPIAKQVGVTLLNAIDGGASDIHIEHTADNVRIRYRVDGELHTTYTLPSHVRNMVVARVKILAKLKLDERRKPQDGRFVARVRGRKVDFRVSTMPTFFGEKVVIRILDPEKGIAQLESTGMTAPHLKLLREMIHRPYGMILITGPTGSGKSTTLYSMLNELDRETKNIVSLEDPIEYHIDGVNQSQVRADIGYTFANGLRSILRQDPDIIMVGEIRDAETANLAIQAALTGHLVFATLHTNTAIGAVPRLIDMGVDPYLIAPTLILTMAQRLVRRTCEGAAVPLTDPATLRLLERQFEDLPDRIREALPLGQGQLHNAEPTATCPSGTKGRVGTFEMLAIDDDIERLILESPTEQDIYELARKKGMLTMKEDAIFKCMQGVLPWSEVNKL